ncbi:MAG: 4-hydroxy-tetrahydrodipicolinate reductase [Verrucomicrobiota bacterium]|nr:4-hydroxy-tetrahydrodipicolinate reductase [Verrucomicrobiota bacterium]
MGAPLRLLVNGARGRMGQMLIACSKGDPALEVVEGIDLGDDLARAVPNCDVLIDFSHHAALELVLAQSLEHGKTLVIGTTGHTDPQLAAVHQAAEKIPIVLAPNYSVGVNTLFWLTRKAAEILGPSFDLEVVEMHHRLKKDSPSGTAKKLAEILAEVRELSYNQDVRHGRHGMVGGRPGAEIGMHAMRGGDVVGDHTVIFASNGERVELAHQATSRETFARGALRAVLWVHGRPAGLYDMQDVLGLR